ncbi:hypothetical protein VOLCADRAFT_104498 [Volvox carteri f. nagariensis]|uniref:TLC domain-containing protein n=1 Tax=Volvox carteri f. nagariensis TaxID=3068 RepID=D8TU06_VOLCA|nr:uncharacterized protein VOLCADRAFT_104498 [Volvox carteri f. nagariensis]EFJ49061.1 hypothetical protein VOLCADRAFT_104498 [Volvox carteri f. nagariensis]|eukprot:XP_002949958.1 hypothetical protein VOLCADRAFT_104498 [Volvox carteri f. nagariensis]
MTPIYLPHGLLERIGEVRVLDETLVTSDAKLTPLGVCAYWALVSLAAFTLMYKLSRYYTPLIFKGYGQMTKYDQRDWDTRLGNILYPIYIVYWAARLIMAEGLFWEMGGSAMVVHHLGSLASVLSASWWGDGHCLTLWMLSTELTTPFIALRFLLDKAGLKSHPVYVVNGIAILISWTVARLLNFVPFFSVVWQHRADIPLLKPVSQVLLVVFPVILAGLNCYWYTKIVRGAIKLRTGIVLYYRHCVLGAAQDIGGLTLRVVLRTNDARSVDAALRRSIPAFNPDVKTIQKSLEDVQYYLRIPQRKPWGSMAANVANCLALAQRPDLILTGVPPAATPAAETLLDSLTTSLRKLELAVKTQQPDAVALRVSDALRTVADLELLQAPGLPFLIPKEYQSLPRLVGRAVVELTVEKRDGSLGFLDPVAGGPARTGRLVLTLDGYSAPLSAGNFLKNVMDGLYNDRPLQVNYTSIFVQGSPTLERPPVPLEILPAGRGEKQSTSELIRSQRSTYQLHTTRSVLRQSHQAEPSTVVSTYKKKKKKKKAVEGVCASRRERQAECSEGVLSRQQLAVVGVENLATS